jgi:uncharacterized peroxidase-related enzyme
MPQNVTPSVPDTVLEIFQEIEQAFGYVPNLFQAYAKYPPLLVANWLKTKTILINGKLLRREVKEAIALRVSHDNKCEYCVAAHSAVLRSLNINDEQISQMFQGVLPENFNDKEIALVNFACKANLDWHSIDGSALEELHKLGIEEAEILEAIGTMELFIAFNRFADVMNIEIDF